MRLASILLDKSGRRGCYHRAGWVVRGAVIALLICDLTPAPTPFTHQDVLGLANVSIADVSDDGRWVAVQSSTFGDRIGIDNSRFGDPTYIPPGGGEIWVIDTVSGARQRVFPGRRQARGIQLSPDGSRLALLVVEGEAVVPGIWERGTAKFTRLTLPVDTEPDDTAQFHWSPDGARLTLTLRPAGWREKAARRFRQETEGSVIVHNGKEPFLNWIELRRMALERAVWTLEVASGRWTEIIPKGKPQSIRFTEDGKALIVEHNIVAKTDYDSLGNGEARVDVVPATGGESRTILKSTKGLALQWSRDGRTYAYAKDGGVFVGSLDGGEARQVLGPKKGDREKEEGPTDGTKGKKEDERFGVTSVSPRGDRLVVSNKQGLWLLDPGTGTRDLVVRQPEEDRDKATPRYQVLDWSTDGSSVYLSYSARTKWERGVSRYDVKSKGLTALFRDQAIYTQTQLSKSGTRWVFLAAVSNRPADVLSAATDFGERKMLFASNPQLADKKLGRTELLSYLDVDGKRQSGVLYYPVDYEKSKRYPTVFNIYEQFFDDTFQSMVAILNNAGYAVVQPSVEFEQGFPGEAWMKAVTSAANKVVEMGVADADRLGLQGTSYGGYATNLLITQTNRFKAAINISGKVNMVSFYTDSPRLGVRNIHAPEKSQDRIGATLWAQPQKYLAHSAILYADRIKTPLLLITGEQDHNVPARQAMEMYYALRRLGREVTWVTYSKGGHGMPMSTVEEVRDFQQRIIDWYDAHLKKPAEGDEKASGQGQ